MLTWNHIQISINKKQQMANQPAACKDGGSHSLFHGVNI